MRREAESREARRTVYRILMLVAMCICAGRICSVISREGDTAFLSANDRSRWCTVAALVEDGSYEIDRFLEIKSSDGRRPWYTIDLVRHRGADGQLHYYSSKPPMLPTMVAGVYWAIHTTTKMSITEQPIYLPRLILLIVNLPLLFLFYWATINSIEWVASGELSRRIAAAATCFGTMLLPFAVSLNNHLPAAAGTALAMYIYLIAAEKMDDSISGETFRSPWLWVLAGIGAGFTAANELPALSMLACWTLLVAIADWRSLQHFISGVAVVAACFFITNSIAHEDLRPPYAHRSNGPVIADLGNGQQPSVEAIAKVLIDNREVQPDVIIDIEPSGKPERWLVQTYDNRQFALNRLGSEGAAAAWQLSYWDDWYDYPGSYWRFGERKGVDAGEPSKLKYFLQFTIGHYGLFSLTPLWLLVPIGLYFGILRGPKDFRLLMLAITVCTITCTAFYVMRPEIDRNYGGVSSCFRWMLWFAPLWLLAIAPVMDVYTESTRLRALLLAFLGFSIFSMAISLSTPWQSPWIYRFWSFLGWLGT